MAAIGALGLGAVCASSAQAERVARAAAPGAPSNVVVKTVSDGQVLLAWSAPSSWGGAKPSRYVIKASHANLKGVSKVVVRATSTRARLNYLYDDVPLTFKVAAKNSAGRVGRYSAASASADPSPTEQVTNRLTLSATPHAQTPCPLFPSETECFGFQQNFFVDRENASPGAHPIIWAQNTILITDVSGQWFMAPGVNVWDLQTGKYWLGGGAEYEVPSFPLSVTVTTAVTHDTLTFSDSLLGSAPFFTWREPSSLASSNPFSVVFDPGVGIDFYDPQAVVVGPGFGWGVSFKSGTAGLLKSAADLRNGTAQTGTDCPVSRPYISTLEAGQGLAWTASGSTARFHFTTAKVNPEGVSFLPQALPCTTNAPPPGIKRPKLQGVATAWPSTAHFAPSLPG